MGFKFPEPTIDGATTDQAMHALHVGDRFTEMLTFWVTIIGVFPFIITIEQHAAGKKSSTMVRVYENGDEFRKRFLNTAGYWIRLSDTGRDVSKWYPWAAAVIKEGNVGRNYCLETKEWSDEEKEHEQEAIGGNSGAGRCSDRGTVGDVR